jgi:hypothetical protein
LGDNDCLTRPFFVRELVARVHWIFARRDREGLADLQRLGEGRVSGSTRNIAVVDLVQSMDAAGTSGVLYLASGAHKARLYFRDGHLVDADLGILRGEEAVYRAFLWYDADFDLELKPIANADVIVCSTQTIVRKGMLRIDAWIRSSEPGVVSNAPAQSEDRESAAPSIEYAVASVDVVSVPPSQVEQVSLQASQVEQRPPSPPVEPVVDIPKPVPSTTRFSSAPWTREIEPSSDDETSDEDDAEAAGLPSRTGRAKGLVAMAIAMAAVVLLAAGMRASRRWQPWRAIASMAGKNTPSQSLAAPAPVPAPKVQGAAARAGDSPRPAPAAVLNVAESPPELGGQGRGASAVSASESATSPKTSAAIARELPNDALKLAAASLSPLVREAQEALLKGQTERALTLAKQTVDERPFDADAWLTLAAAQKASGDLAAARETYLNCIQRAHTASLNHCRVLASRPRAPEAHGLTEFDVHGAPAGEPAPPPAPAAEVAQSHATRSVPAPGSDNRVLSSAPPATKSNDGPVQAPPASAAKGATAQSSP